jgi:adenosylcobinamide kinase / adenosylcobinamide-phosphate guanylyltransferase
VLIVVGGGARSGKSRFAEQLCVSYGVRRAYIATAQALDSEMAERIAKHQEQRGNEFVTFEEPLDLAEILQRNGADFDVILVDCLTLWLSNLLHHRPDSDWEALFHHLAQVAADSSAKVVLVTNEVGCGIVPVNALARKFQDESGRMNQIVVQHAAEAHWVVFGIPVKLK